MARREPLRALTAWFTLVAFASTSVLPAAAHAQPRAEPEPGRASDAADALAARTRTDIATDLAENSKIDDSSTPLDAAPAAKDDLQAAAASSVSKDAPEHPAARPDDLSSVDQVDALAAPVGGNKTGVSGQSISVPRGAGTIQGMGESFSAQLSTGSASYSVPIRLNSARGAAQPSLALSYSSSGGAGVAGFGWDIGSAFIARQTDRGLPSYDDRSTWHVNQDRFTFGGGQELVPICVVSPTLGCSGALTEAGEVMPIWSANHQYFRSRVEGSYLRFFWSPDRRTWRVQDKEGITTELGVPLDGSEYLGGLERNPDDLREIYRWHVVRQYDALGTPNPATGNPSPFNVVVYRYSQDGGRSYLSDIYDTSPAAAPTTLDLTRFAHHTRLVYEARPDPSRSYRSGWLIEDNLRLKRVDVTSKTFNSGETGARRLVRRYHLGYAAGWHRSLLETFQMEGRCTGDEQTAPAETDEKLPEQTTCGRLPPLTFEYAHVTGYSASGAPRASGITGFEAFDERARSFVNSPAHSIDEANTDLVDVNADSLPDVLVTASGPWKEGFGLFLNGPAGASDTFATSTRMTVTGVLGAGLANLQLASRLVSPLDLDGDAIVDLLHAPDLVTSPKTRAYGIYTPTTSNGVWTWQGRAVTSPIGQGLKLNFGVNADRTKIADVNFDGLVDLVVSTGTEFQTFLALGRLPGGDGQFGSGSWSTPATANLSTSPIARCVPYRGTAVQLSDPDVHFADMNGDGITDLLRVASGKAYYWPGRGNGFWGTGRRGDCGSNQFATGREVDMTTKVALPTDPTGLRIEDINSDGLDDILELKTTSLNVWLNIDGRAFSSRYTIEGTPNTPIINMGRVRIADVNGSGSRDVVWGQSGSYSYLDPTGGIRPGLLVGVRNGLGKSTRIEYSTAAQEMLAAERTQTACNAEDKPWTSAWCAKLPISVTVVKRSTESANLTVAGRRSDQVTEYSYRDPVFEGRQREFRGFRKARSKRVGDLSSPTDYAESTFLLGECEDETNDGVADCSSSERWRDNPREALKGLPVVTEQYDDNGVRLTTELTTYRLRHLYTGLDGRAVRAAVPNAKKTYSYNTDAGPRPAQAATFLAVQLEDSYDPTFNPQLRPPANPGGIDPNHGVSVAYRHYSNQDTATIDRETITDFFGNVVTQIDRGCTSGILCPTTPTAFGSDEIIYKYSLPLLIAGNGGKWLWRTDRGYVTASKDTAIRQHTTTTYDSAGLAKKTTVVLSGTLPLQRFHEVPGTTLAPNPIDASVDNATGITVGDKTYDTLGNLTTDKGALGRCRRIAYDTLVTNGVTLGYAQFPVTETLYTTGANCTGGSLANTAMYDRGFSSLKTATDLAVQQSKVDLDEFGRTIATWKPHPTTSGALSPQPSHKFEYILPSSGEGVSIVHSMSQDAANASTQAYLESWAFVDGMGRTIANVAEADSSALGRDGGAYIVSNITTHDAKGAPERKYLAYFTNTAPLQLTFASAPSTRCGSGTRDAFGRAVANYDVDGGADCRGTMTMLTRYNAMGFDAWDAADLDQTGPHKNTPASTRHDGHGRPIELTSRIKVGSTIESHVVRTTYNSTGLPVTITRQRLGFADAPIMRWMRYDSLGRLVLNVDPHTSTSFTSDPNVDLSTSPLKAWRYAYNDAGDLVGTSDARGCGQNFTYDFVGRTKSEDYSPCTTAHGAYTAPDNAAGTGMEVAYYYDAIVANRPSGFTLKTGLTSSGPQALRKGRLAAVFDLGQATFYTYDPRGRTKQIDKRLQKPPAVGAGTSTVTAAAYMPRWYTKTTTFDSLDRELTTTTGATQALLLAGGASVITTNYSLRGTVASVTSSYGTLVAGITRDANSLTTQTVYGDAATTTTDRQYDNRQRLEHVLTARGDAPIWGTSYTPPPVPISVGPTTLQNILEDTFVTYDVVGNPKVLTDNRDPAEWPAGAKPVSRTASYDDFYRLTRLDYAYQTSAADTWTSPYSPELAGVWDPRRPVPAAHQQVPTRPKWHTFAYDWRGNTTRTDDDLHVYYDRSLGNVTNNSAGGKPYQLLSTAPISAGTYTGSTVGATYDATGNLLGMQVQRSNANCVPVGAQCTHQLSYQWDPVGRLVSARRTANDDIYVLSSYESGDTRTIKTYIDGATSFSTYYVFDTLEIRRASYDAVANEIALTSDTEVPYLASNGIRLGRVVWEQPSDGEPRLQTANSQHVFLQLADQLGSTSTVIDWATGELVERTTYQPYGATESDYRPERWKGHREDYRFTGKEEDAEVGLTYFGKRFLSPYLGRWISADPLAVHIPGQADLNLYAYVSGRVLRNTDPLGLETDADGNRVGTTVIETRCRETGCGRPEVSKLIRGGVSMTVDSASGKAAPMDQEPIQIWADVMIQVGPNEYEIVDEYVDADSGIAYKGGLLLDPMTQEMVAPPTLEMTQAPAQSPLVQVEDRDDGPVVAVNLSGSATVGVGPTFSRGFVLHLKPMRLESSFSSSATDGQSAGLTASISGGAWENAEAYDDHNSVFLQRGYKWASRQETLYLRGSKQPSDASYLTVDPRDVSGVEYSLNVGPSLSLLPVETGYTWSGVTERTTIIGGSSTKMTVAPEFRDEE